MANATAPSLSTGVLAYHVLNQRAGRLPFFEKPVDYFAFESDPFTYATLTPSLLGANSRPFSLHRRQT
jgi:hypothetical protein